MNSQQVTFAAIATHAMSATIQRGKRRSKRDQNVSIDRGDVVLLTVPEPGRAPFLIKVPGGVEGLQFHPGNYISSPYYYKSSSKKDNQILYEDRYFVIFTNLDILTGSIIGMLKAGGDGTLHLPLMERAVVNYAYKNEVSDEMDKAWTKYLKLRELFQRPGTLGEGATAKKFAVRVLSNLIINHIALKGVEHGTESQP